MKIKRRHIKMARAAWRTNGRDRYLINKDRPFPACIRAWLKTSTAIKSWHRAARTPR